MELSNEQIKEIQSFGLVKCEFKTEGCDCSNCGNNKPDERIWYERTSYEYDEGEYYCDECALEVAKRFDNFDPEKFRECFEEDRKEQT